MKIPKSVMKDIIKMKKLRDQSNEIETRIAKWFESKGFDMEDLDFIDMVLAKISYGEFDDECGIQKHLDEYLDELSLR